MKCNALFSLLLVVAIEQVATQSGLFKINKLNLIWTKAQHSLGPSKLKDLKSDLAKQETDELTLKKMKVHGQDKDGMFEATTRKKLLSILTKYHLDRYFDDVSSSKQPVETEKAKAIFRDKKLDKLWKKAEKMGFSQEQLMILQDEFQHHQDRLDEHYETVNDLEQKLESITQNSNKHSNSIEASFPLKNKLKESKPEKKARLDENLQQSLKDKYSNIKKNLNDLHKKIVSGIPVVDENRPFEEGRVNDLWSAAIKANFTETELESIQEELQHYETRVKKLKHFQVQLEKDLIANKDALEEPSDDSKHIKKRIRELSETVEKIQKKLEKRIMGLRDEL